MQSKDLSGIDLVLNSLESGEGFKYISSPYFTRLLHSTAYRSKSNDSNKVPFELYNTQIYGVRSNN